MDECSYKLLCASKRAGQFDWRRHASTVMVVAAMGCGGRVDSGNSTGRNATGGNATWDYATGGAVPAQIASRWSFEGATDLPTDFSYVRNDMVTAGFVQKDCMCLLGMSSLSGDQRYSMWEL